MDVFYESSDRKQYEHCYNGVLQLFNCPYEEQWIATSFGDSYVLKFGEISNPPLLLLHGMTMSSVMWYPNVKQWAQSYCIYAIDIIGDIGRSIANEAILTHEEAVSWLKQTVDAIGLRQFFLAGHSIGGYIATCFTLAHPEYVSKLVLFAPAAIFHRLQLKFFYYAFPGMIFQTEKWVDRFFRNLSEDGTPFHPSYRSFLLSGYHHVIPLLRLYPLKMEPEELNTLQLPILLMIGDQEVIYPGAEALQYAQEHIKDIECVLVEGGNHLFTIEQAPMVNERLLMFLSKSTKV